VRPSARRGISAGTGGVYTVRATGRRADFDLVVLGIEATHRKGRR